LLKVLAFLSNSVGNLQCLSKNSTSCPA